MKEHDIEMLALSYFSNLGYEVGDGQKEFGAGALGEREEWSDVILWKRFENKILQINPLVPKHIIKEAIRKFKITLTDEGVLPRANLLFHQMLTLGIQIIRTDDEGKNQTYNIQIIDSANSGNNDWLAVQQLEVQQGISRRIPDLVVYLNGLPISVFELKTLARESVHLIQAYNQLETYKREITPLFKTNVLLAISNLKYSRVGSLTSGWNRFVPWRDMDSINNSSNKWELEEMISNLFNKEHLIDYILNFVLFQNHHEGLSKIIGGYHQCHAAKKALVRTREEVSKSGRGTIGVVWHTQGSGKSLTMVFLSQLIARDLELENPTILVVTDRNDLDGQLYHTFNLSTEYLGQQPVQIASKKDLISILKQREVGGIFFSTIQKFLPVKGEEMELLSDRRNIIVITDEAHRSQYDFVDGYAHNLRTAFPQASFIGFTGTPISYVDRDTRLVFGDDISVYDLHRSVEDGSTVRIYHEQRKIPLSITKNSNEIDTLIDEITEGEELATSERAKKRFSRLDKIFGSASRLITLREQIVQDIESRWEENQSQKMMIVCATRHTCVRMNDYIKEIKPEWFSDNNDDSKGVVKVIMTGSSSDHETLQIHVRDSKRRKLLGNLFRDPDSDFKIAIVCDMWLTGFDAPSLSTMYIDKPMKGHSLMQALARVNRSFKKKKGGTVVDFYGLGKRIAEAINTYSAKNQHGTLVYDIDEAERILEEKHAVICHLFRDIPFDDYWDLDEKGKSTVLGLLIGRVNNLKPKDVDASRKRFSQHVSELNQAYSLAKTTSVADKIRGDIRLFRLLYACANHRAPEEHKDPDFLASAIQQVIDDSISTEGPVDILNLTAPGRSIFDEDFLHGVSSVANKNVQHGVLMDLIRGELKDMRKRFLVQSRKFSAMLQASLDRYQQSDDLNIDDAINSMYELIEHIKNSQSRGEILGLDDAQLAFYDALETNEASVRALGEDKLCRIAVKAAAIVQDAAKSEDWLVNDRKQDRLYIAISDLLEDEGYPEDKKRAATNIVLEQAMLSSMADHEIRDQY